MSPFFYIHTSLCALLMVVIQHSSVCMLGSFCMRLLNNVWLNVACVRKNECHKFFDSPQSPPAQKFSPFLYVRCFLIKYLKLHFLLHLTSLSVYLHLTLILHHHGADMSTYNEKHIRKRNEKFHMLPSSHLPNTHFYLHTFD